LGHAFHWLILLRQHDRDDPLGDRGIGHEDGFVSLEGGSRRSMPLSDGRIIDRNWAPGQPITHLQVAPVLGARANLERRS
jgi:hypothetical protein